MVIVENYPVEKRPWDKRDDRILEGFFLSDKTYREIAAEVGISQERVWQLIATQVRRILHPVGLEKYWNPNYDPAPSVFSPEFVETLKSELTHKYGDFNNWPIKEVGLSSRTYNTLLRANINTLGMLLERLSSIAAIRRMGTKSLGEINNMLEAFGFI